MHNKPSEFYPNTLPSTLYPTPYTIYSLRTFVYKYTSGITQLKEPSTSTDIEPWVPFFVPSHTPVAPACDEHLKVPFSKPSDTPVTLACDDQDLVPFSAQPSHLVKSACEDEMVSKQVNTTPAPVQRGKPGDQLKVQVLKEFILQPFNIINLFLGIVIDQSSTIWRKHSTEAL